MLLIVDNCVAWSLVSAPPSAAVKALLDFLRSGVLVYGGKLETELYGNERLRKLIQTLTLAGRAQKISASSLAPVERALEKSGHLKSNDGHVIALALVSGARLVYTSDAALAVDVKNKRLLDAPRGKVYKTAQHKRLLRRDYCGRPVLRFAG